MAATKDFETAALERRKRQLGFDDDMRAVVGRVFSVAVDVPDQLLLPVVDPTVGMNAVVKVNGRKLIIWCQDKADAVIGAGL